MVKGFRQIAVLTMLSRVLGFARDTAYAIVFGPSTLLDAWFIAFRIPNLGRRLFGEGAAAAAVIPVYSEQLNKDISAAGRLARTVLAALFLVLSAIVLIGEIIVLLFYIFGSHSFEMKLVFALTAITLPYMILICLVAVVAGLLNVHRHFVTPALAPVIMNICIIAGVIAAAFVFPVSSGPDGGISQKLTGFDHPGVRQIFFVAFAVVIAGLLEFAVQLLPYFKKGLTLRPAWDIHSEPFRRILMLMAPMIIGLAVTQINTLADDIIAWCFSGSPEKGAYFNFLGYTVTYPLWRGSVSYLGYAQHLYQLPLGIFGISLATALFPVMSTHAAKKDYHALAGTVSMGLCSSVFVALPCSVGLILVAEPFVSVWLRHGNFHAGDVTGVVRPLMFYSVGITGYFLQHIVVRAFHSLQDPAPPVRTAMLAVVTNLVLNLTLIWFMGVAGLALSTALCSYLQVIILLYILRRRLGPAVLQSWRPIVAKTVIATIIMTAVAVAILFSMRQLQRNMLVDGLRVAAVIPVSAAVYVLVSRLLNNPMLGLVTGKKTTVVNL